MSKNEQSENQQNQPQTLSDLQPEASDKAESSAEAQRGPDIQAMRKRWEEESAETQMSEEDKAPLEPWDSEQWEAPWGVTYTFVMPPAKAYRAKMNDRRVGISDQDVMLLDPSQVEPLMLGSDSFISPRPNEDELTAGQWEQLCLQFYMFLRRSQ